VKTACLYAAVVNDLHRAAGRSGVGTVMGSKNLKAIAVRGTKGVGNIQNPKAFMAATKAAKKVLAENGVTGQGLPAYGTQVLMNVINEVGALPTRNHRDVQFEGAKDISAEAMATPRATDGKKHLVTNQACFGCTIACGRISKIDESHFSVQNKPQYWGASGGLEYEAAWALGAANGVNDLEALQYANLICNEEGMDPISFGATIGAVMELYEMGVLTKEQIGIEAPFGSAKALCELVDMTAHGVGFGKEIGLGSKRLTAKYGHPDLSMSVKGQEFPAYDGRVVQGIGLAYATSNRGACHLRGYTIASEVLGIPVKTEPTEHEGKPELVKAFQDATAAFDSAGICVFTSFAWTLADVAPQVQAACGEEFTMEHLNHIGERIWNMEREFNNAAGFTKADDNLPKRLLTEAAKTGPGKGVVSKLPEMLPKYYEVRGWDTEGRPTADTANVWVCDPVCWGLDRFGAPARVASPVAAHPFLFQWRMTHEAPRHPGRRPGRRDRGRNHPQAGPERPHHHRRRRKRAAVFAHGHSLPADGQQVDEARHLPAQGRRALSDCASIWRGCKAKVWMPGAHVTLATARPFRSTAADRHRLSPGHARRFRASTPGVHPAGRWPTRATS
jgi:aldehyde:ferredoxin oxidoreductase